MIAWSIIRINIVIKEPTYGYQNCNISRILIFGGSLFTQVTIQVNIILDHIDTTVNWPMYEGS